MHCFIASHLDCALRLDLLCHAIASALEVGVEHVHVSISLERKFADLADGVVTRLQTEFVTTKVTVWYSRRHKTQFQHLFALTQHTADLAPGTFVVLLDDDDLLLSLPSASMAAGYAYKSTWMETEHVTTAAEAVAAVAAKPKKFGMELDFSGTVCTLLFLREFLVKHANKLNDPCLDCVFVADKAFLDCAWTDTKPFVFYRTWKNPRSWVKYKAAHINSNVQKQASL